MTALVYSWVTGTVPCVSDGRGRVEFTSTPTREQLPVFAVTLPRDHQDAHQFECNPTAERGFARYALIASSNEPACVVCQLSTHFAYPDPDHRVAWPRVHDSPPSAIVIISESKDTAIHFPPLTAGISAECMNKGANTLTAFPWVRDGPSVVHRGTSTAHSRGNSPFCDN